MIKNLFAMAIIILCGVLVWNAVHADPARSLSWDNPTTRLDGTVFDPATEQAYNRIYADCGAGVVLIEEVQTTTTWNGVTQWECQTFYVTAVDTDGLESDLSTDSVFFKAPPGQVKNLTK